MRRITIWITAAIAVASLALAHWANVEGGGGKTPLCQDRVRQGLILKRCP